MKYRYRVASAVLAHPVQLLVRCSHHTDEEVEWDQLGGDGEEEQERFVRRRQWVHVLTN